VLEGRGVGFVKHKALVGIVSTGGMLGGDEQSTVCFPPTNDSMSALLGSRASRRFRKRRASASTSLSMVNGGWRAPWMEAVAVPRRTRAAMAVCWCFGQWGSKGTNYLFVAMTTWSHWTVVFTGHKIGRPAGVLDAN
jgi:hypothetical protein